MSIRSGSLAFSVEEEIERGNALSCGIFFIFRLKERSLKRMFYGYIYQCLFVFEVRLSFPFTSNDDLYVTLSAGLE
jgi:hypothetical protein